MEEEGEEREHGSKYASAICQSVPNLAWLFQVREVSWEC